VAAFLSWLEMYSVLTTTGEAWMDGLALQVEEKEELRYPFFQHKYKQAARSPMLP